MAEIEILCFPVGDGPCALRLEHVREIVELGSEPAAVPRAPGSVAGLCDLRGRIVTLLGLEALLGRRVGAGAGAPKALILRPPRDRVGLLVRGDVEIARVPEESVETPDGASRAEGWVPGTGGERIPLLDPGALLEGVREQLAGRVRGV